MKKTHLPALFAVFAVIGCQEFFSQPTSQNKPAHDTVSSAVPAPTAPHTASPAQAPPVSSSEFRGFVKLAYDTPKGKPDRVKDYQILYRYVIIPPTEDFYIVKLEFKTESSPSTRVEKLGSFMRENYDYYKSGNSVYGIAPYSLTLHMRHFFPSMLMGLSVGKKYELSEIEADLKDNCKRSGNTYNGGVCVGTDGKVKDHNEIFKYSREFKSVFYLYSEASVTPDPWAGSSDDEFNYKYAQTPPKITTIPKYLLKLDGGLPILFSIASTDIWQYSEKYPFDIKITLISIRIRGVSTGTETDLVSAPIEGQWLKGFIHLSKVDSWVPPYFKD